MLSDIGGSIKFAQDLTLAEQQIYGSARHGMYTPDRLLARFHFSITDTLQIAMDSFKFVQSTTRFMRVVTYKQYELSNHLGNVLSTVYDRRTPIEIGGGNHTIKYFEADVIFATDYYPFGSGENYTKTGGNKAGRYYSYSAYRYGFNNQEKDGELGEYYSFEYRVHDARLGRFLSVDPLFKKYSYLSVYQYAANSPIISQDLEGLESSTDGLNANEQPLVLPNGENRNWSVEKTIIQSPSNANIRKPEENLLANYSATDLPNQNIRPINLVNKSTVLYFWWDERITGVTMNTKNNENCWYLSRLNTLNTGGKPCNSNDDVILTEDNNFFTNSIDYINSQLESNRSIQVGIDLPNFSSASTTTMRDRKRLDQTDHFVTIVGRAYDDCGYMYFIFVENAVVNRSLGIDPKNNRIYSENNKLIFLSGHARNSDGVVVRIQKNK